MVLDDQDHKDAQEFLQGFVWEVRSSVESRVRSRMRPYGDRPEPSEEEVAAAVEEAVASELGSCGRKLAKLLMDGVR